MDGLKGTAGALRTARTAAAVALVAALVAACGAGSPDGQQSASASTNPSASVDPTDAILIWSDPDHAAALQASAGAHQAATGVEVLVRTVGSDLAQIRDDVTGMAPQGQGPDLFVGESNWVGGLVDSGLIVPVDLAANAGNFRSVAVSGFAYRGRTFGVPFATENLALLRNTDLAPKAPKSIEAMARLGLALEREDKATLPIALPVGPRGSAYHWYPLFSAGGGAIFGRDIQGGYSADDLRVAQPGSETAAGLLARLTEDGVLDQETTIQSALSTFTAGKSPYLITGPWSMEAIEASGVPFVVEEVPGFDEAIGSRSQAPVTSQGLMLSAFSRNSTAAQQYLTTTAMTTDVMTALASPGSLAPAWSQSYEVAATDPVIAGFAEYADASIPMPNLDEMAAVWPALSRAQVDVMSGKDPARAMQAAARKIQTAIDAG